MKSGCILLLSLFLFLSFGLLGQTSPCDLNNNSKVDGQDAQLSVLMAIGRIACTAKINGQNVCDQTTVIRVVNAAIGKGCLVNKTVTLTWTASTSANVVGYNVFRGTTSGGPYTKITSSPVAAVTYVDSNVQFSTTYYYVVTAVDGSGNSSVNSNEATVAIPSS